MILWVIRYKWFRAFYQSVLIVRGESGGKTIFLVSSEGSTQGCPLAGLSYGIFPLPLILQLKLEFPQGKSPWYAEDGATAGTLKRIVIF